MPEMLLTTKRTSTMGFARAVCCSGLIACLFLPAAVADDPTPANKDAPSLG
jgi:hypothetical protein